MLAQKGNPFSRIPPLWRCGGSWGRKLSSCSPQSSHKPLMRFSEEQELLRMTVRRFAEEKIQPNVSSMDLKGEIPSKLINDLFSQGFLSVEVSEEFGGTEGSFIDTCIVIEEIARIDPSVAALVDIHNTLIIGCVQKWGTEDQKRTYLPKLGADTVGSFCLSEANSGSDAFALKTRARKTSDGWEINGSKMWISNATEAGLFLIFATADPELRHRGITAFLVEKEAPGLTLGPKIEKLGIRASSTHEVILNNVKVPDTAVLGEIGQGYRVAIESLNEGRIGIAAQMVGLAQGALDTTLPYIHDRHQFGKPLASFQSVQFATAEMATELEAGRLLMSHAAALKEAGKPFTKEAAMAKFFCAQMAEKTASRCVDLHGGNGFTKDFPIEKYFRDSKIGSIYEGTNHMQLMTIAKIVGEKYGSGS